MKTKSKARSDKASFYVLVMDHDRKRMSLHGPTDDDTKINARVVEAQKTDRNITCTTVARPNLAAAERDAKGLKPAYEIVDDACAV